MAEGLVRSWKGAGRRSRRRPLRYLNIRRSQRYQRQCRERLKVWARAGRMAALEG